MGAERLHARGAGHGCAGNDFSLAAPDEAAEVDFGMQHVLLPLVAVLPKIVLGFEPGVKAVVSRADDSVVGVEGGCSDFAVGIFGSQSGGMSQCHDILRNRKALVLLHN